MYSSPATNHKTHIYGYSNTWHYPMSFWFYMWSTAHYPRRARKDVTITRILSKLLNIKTYWFLISANLFPLAHKLVQTVRWSVGLWSLSNIQEKRTLRIKPTLRLREQRDFIQYALILLIVGRFISNKKMYYILCLFFFG